MGDLYPISIRRRGIGEKTMKTLDTLGTALGQSLEGVLVSGAHALEKRASTRHKQKQRKLLMSITIPVVLGTVM